MYLSLTEQVGSGCTGEKLRYLRCFLMSNLSTWKNHLQVLIITSLKNTGNFTLFATSWQDLSSESLTV